ncbi:unnamed protein product [Symbiodinium sp. KB8]|nr:unnamed protein product [Symbiodinium sp. KB8]
MSAPFVRKLPMDVAARIFEFGERLLGPIPTAAVQHTLSLDGFRGDTAELFFDLSKLHPRGMGKDLKRLYPPNLCPISTEDKFAHELPVPVTVAGKRVHPLAHSPVAMPEVPQIILRGPTDMGGCGDLEVIADTSTQSGGRRWKSVVWECVETRPDGSLPQESQDRLFSACASRIQPLLNAKPWCGLGFEQQLVAQTCELRVVIPSATWCGLSSITLGVTLTRADGYAAYDTWTTRILPLTRIPAAGAVGSNEVHVKPQRLQGEPTGRLRLEVASESDAQMIGRCSCNLTRAPNPDGSESRVVVDWYYGEVINGMVPRHFEMSKILKDESASANVLEVLLRGEIMRPGSTWKFSARVAYAVHSENEGSYVPFTITVGDLEPPVATLVGPHRANNDDCSFALDASDSMARELMFTTETLGRRLQANQTPPTQAPLMGLQYSWRVRQLALGTDDALVYSVPNVALALIDLEAFTGSQLLVPQAILPEGLYVFTVEVHDALYPSLVSSASATVMVDKKADVPVISVDSPSGTVGPTGSVQAIFKQVGFGACVVPTVDMEGTHARTTILLMRGILGQPRNYMRAYKELTFTNRVKDMAGGVANSLWLYVEADRSDLEKGFIYSYRRKKAFELTAYKEKLLAAGKDSMTAAGRHMDTEPATDPVDLGILQVDSEVFNIPWGPTAGSLDVLDPVGRIGIAMSAYEERVVTSYDRVTSLLEYIRRSRQAILQAGASAMSALVWQVCAAVFELPSMYDYDFRSMMEWNAASGLPMPNLSQPIYGAPIVSRETREEVVTYLLDIMGALNDIVNALEPDSLGAETTQSRRLQEQYFQDTTSNTSTPLHAEVVASALAHLASNLAPIDEPELFVYLGRLTSGLVVRIRSSRGDIRKAGNAPQDENAWE